MQGSPNVTAFPALRSQSALRRPAPLIRAARAGQPGWIRNRDLPRLLRCDDCPEPGRALARLRYEEQGLNDARLSRSAEYDLHRHILLLIAILAEMRLAAAQRGGLTQRQSGIFPPTMRQQQMQTIQS